MSEIQHVHAPSRYIPAREDWLKGWCGPVEWLDTFRVPEGRWVCSAYGAGGMANGAPAERIRLDPRRPEVRDMLARALGLPMFVRSGPYAIPCAWWCGATGRALTAVCRVAPNLYIGADMVVIEAGAAPRFGFDTSRDRVLGADCALVTPTGLLLPPLAPGGAPILWSDDV